MEIGGIWSIMEMDENGSCGFTSWWKLFGWDLGFSDNSVALNVVVNHTHFHAPTKNHIVSFVSHDVPTSYQHSGWRCGFYMLLYHIPNKFPKIVFPFPAYVHDIPIVFPWYFPWTMPIEPGTQLLGKLQALQGRAWMWCLPGWSFPCVFQCFCYTAWGFMYCAHSVYIHICICDM